MKQDWDEKIYQSIALKRSAFFRPIAMILSKLHISPDALSYAGIAVMLAFALKIAPIDITAYPNHPIYAVKSILWLLLAVLILDQLDGAVARYNKTDSDRGKFVDVIVDSTNFSIFLVGIIKIGLIGAATGGAMIYLAALSRVLAVIRRNSKHPNDSDWLFYSGTAPLVSSIIYISIGVFAFDTLTTSSYLSGFIRLSIVILTIGAVRDYWYLRYRLKRG